MSSRNRSKSPSNSSSRRHHHRDRDHRYERHDSSHEGESRRHSHRSHRSHRSSHRHESSHHRRRDEGLKNSTLHDKGKAVTSNKDYEELKNAVKSDSSDDEEEEWVIKEDSGPLDYSFSKTSNNTTSTIETQKESDLRLKDQSPVPNNSIPNSTSQTTQLNQLKSQILRAKLLGQDEKATELQSNYDKLSAEASRDDDSGGLKVLDSVEIRKYHLSENIPKNVNDMTIADMVKEEKLSSNHLKDALDVARQIGKDASYDNDDKDYLYDNAEKFAKEHVSDPTVNRNQIIEKTRRLNTIADSCPLCINSTEDPSKFKVKPISIGTRVYLANAPEPSLTSGVSAIIPIDHHINTQYCDDDEWEEIRNFMKCLTILYNGKIIFYENAVRRNDHAHACIFAVPIKSQNAFDTAPAVFREAFETGDEEWSSHKKVINTMNVPNIEPRLSFRRSIAKEAPYFHAWFNINGGYGHIVEDEHRWPKGDLFAREIIGQMLRTDITVIRKRTRWSSNTSFNPKWQNLDWTKQLY